jgi:hypothetical protein
MVASGDVKEPSAKIIMHVFEAASNGGDYLPYRYRHCFRCSGTTLKALKKNFNTHFENAIAFRPLRIAAFLL